MLYRRHAAGYRRIDGQHFRLYRRHAADATVDQSRPRLFSAELIYFQPISSVSLSKNWIFVALFVVD